MKRLFFFFLMALLPGALLYARDQQAELQLFQWSFSSRPYWATSEYQESPASGKQIKIDGAYGAGKAFDGNPGSVWIPGGEDRGRGEFLLFAVGEDFAGFQIAPGSFSDPNINRPSSVEVMFFVAFGSSGHDTDITRSYRAFPVGEKLTAGLKDSPALQKVAFQPDWDTAESMILQKSEEISRSFGLFPVDLDIRYIVKVEIDSVYGEKARTGIAEIIPLRGGRPEERDRSLTSLPKEEKAKANAFLRVMWSSFARLCEEGQAVRAAAFFAPEAIMQGTGLFTGELEEKDRPLLESFLGQALSLPEEESFDGIRAIRFISYHSRDEAHNIPYAHLLFRLETEDGGTYKGSLAVQPETGLFVITAEQKEEVL